MKTKDKVYSDDELLNSLKDFFREHGRSPKMPEFKGKKPSCGIISRRFGSWVKALEAAGLEQAKRHNEFSKEYLIECLYKYHSEFKKVPTSRALREAGYPGIKTYSAYFGSFKNALSETGLLELREDKHQFSETYTDEQMLVRLNEYMIDKESIPLHRQIKRELKNPSVSAYERRFSSIFHALKMIGFDYEKQIKENESKYELYMIERYKELCKELNKIASSRDIDRNSKMGKCPAMKTYDVHFGGLYNLQLLCGLTPTSIGINVKTRENLLEDILMLKEKLGRTPSRNDLVFFDNVASSRKYSDVFGSWNDAILAAGLKPNTDVYYSTSGEKCLSYYELLFTNMLEDYNIKYKKEAFYRDYMDTDRRYRFDFVIELEKPYFIEIFGITCNEEYQSRTLNKINLCNKNGISLIEIYPCDYKGNKSSSIHEMLMSKIEQFTK